MTSSIVSKKNLQAMLRALRCAGLTVTKMNGGYECISPSGQLLLKAMDGKSSYLVRMAADLFV